MVRSLDYTIPVFGYFQEMWHFETAACGVFWTDNVVGTEWGLEMIVKGIRFSIFFGFVETS
ncbi:hypothetical protein BPAE_0361g00020 [Botrytis paeoniae]|uniref:Uncharacterized protein n=1 Tax=Botrytis paeoniae TaxID=278948 RepID=A0A4Z1F3M9_9HELO|nr:hypothetical protein BPAE_0361g00020 [Botrytis paeoniae]